MEFYPAELTSPPVPLVALIGKPELHISLGDYLRSQNVPRIHSIGISDAHSAAGTFGVRKAAPSGATPGILKAGWLRKHRTSRPAVAAMIVDCESVVGDPSAWAWLVSQLDAVKSAVKSRSTRIVVIIAQQGPAAGVGGEVPEDRIAMICRQAGVDRRCVLTFAPSQGLPALQVVGKVLHEQAVLHYTADAQRRLAAHAHRNVPSTDLNLRTAFKACSTSARVFLLPPATSLLIPATAALSTLAEFRGDWAGAVRLYREAYGYVPQVLAGSMGQPQRFAEVRTVAEYVHVKVASLLLLALKQAAEAVSQFDAHLRLFRQYTVMAELLLSSDTDMAALKREHQPGHLYLAAAQAAIERRKVEPGLFVGQVVLLAADPAAAAVAAGSAVVAAALAGIPVSGAAAAAGATKRLSEDQFEVHLEAEEGKVQHSRATVDLLRTAQESLQSSGRRTGKTLQHAMQLLGHELLEAGDTAAAERLLAEVAGAHLWLPPLEWLPLPLAPRGPGPAAHTELSLELAALQDSSLDGEQRCAMATAAVSVLALGEAAGEEQPQAGGAAQYSVAGADSGWLTVLPICAGFFDPARAPAAAAAAAPAARSSVRFAAAVWNNAPIDLPLVTAEVQLRDGTGAFTAVLLPEPSGSGRGGPASAAAGLVLPAGGCLRLGVAVPVRCSGQLQATALVLQFGAGSSIAFQLRALMPAAAGQQHAASTPAAMQAGAVGWLRGGWASSRPPFSAAAGFLAGSCAVEVPPQHAPPLLLLQAPDILLQGEQAAVTVAVAAAAADAIHGATLRATAVHADSQQQLGLVTVGAAAPAQPSAEGGGASELGGRLVQHLGQVAAGEQRQVVLLLDVRYRGTVHLNVELLYTAACSGGSGASEAGRCSASLAVQAQPPWKLGLQLLGPPATHTLLAALQPAAGGGSGTSGSEGGAGVMPLEQQQRRLQGLSVQDTPAPPSAATEAAMGEGARDLSVLLLRSLPPRLVLPARQRCGALVQLQSMAACQLDILAVEVEAAEGVVVVPAAAPAVPARGGGGGGVDAPADTLGRSDIFATAFTISSSSSGAAAELPSLGFLRLRWRRHQRRPPLLAAAARGTSQLSAAAAQAAAAEVLPGSGVDGAGSPRAQAAAAAVAAPACEVLVPLPAVCFLPPLLTAEMRFPPAATAGSPTELLLQLRNGGSTCQEVAVTVGDPHGFLLAGLLRLPEIVATAVQYSKAVEVTRGCSAFVERPPELQQQPDEQQQLGQLSPGGAAAATAPAIPLEPGII
ncbi:hypothetical protein CHLNCDRAFT_137536 [Chlorella variabilis]|uniref:Trafficking protein particle complex subunit 11 domain-containing protein n=1 Tax=Chlorella variabilis TaxID=554065 RepID=E1Z3X5_CHLVA|nr:hypothetical protein CHLNCDRAFT_137536 [Chlorella variabilis]EFN58956.1 hypothetical protein CHLNCDRAFT_137536 [Chlorella variabilis]|eukprot:XP_005851058.1 hypothetical protein CHLNCDRAFT_137536 [Chlorella variabilis]